MNATITPDRADTKDIRSPAANNSPTAEPAGASAPPGADRDGRGRFVAGNKSGHGNPFARRTARLRSLLLEAVTDEDMRVIAQKLVEQAKAGDLAAMKLLFGYVIGKPIPCADPDRLDVEEWQLSQESPVIAELNGMVNQRMPADIACILGGAIVEANSAEVIARLSAVVARPAAGATAASANGKNGHAPPSTNGRNGHAAPSTNGRNGHSTPSTNGKNGHVPPSANGKNGHAERLEEDEPGMDVSEVLRKTRS